MVLLCAEGLQSKEVAARLGVHEHTVGKWRRQFVEDGIEGLTDEYRAGRPRTVSDAQVTQVIERTLNTTLKDATHWSIRSMATEIGLSHTTIRRIWSAFSLQPHRADLTFQCLDPCRLGCGRSRLCTNISPRLFPPVVHAVSRTAKLATNLATGRR
ncbi:hypothetical protein MSKU9_3190 [Komagataeibacter diospyri]|uniref:Transposase n=1 Tax=Komagataeibacter diospyri TaxID=1932662 RepID=A0A4P5NTU4_9PROT|nr:hypothetical protein MSKU9_3190 [Komagataeibacter diospyri]